MAIPNVYWWRRGAATNATGTPSVFELINGTQSNLIGDADVGDGLEVGFAEDFSGTNCVLEFQGKRYLWHKQYIKEENAGGTGNWGVVHTTLATSGTNLKSGLFTVLRNGVPNMVGIAAGGSGRAAFRFDGTTWTNVTVAGSFIRSGSAITYNNKLFFNVFNGTLVYDSSDDSIAFYSAGGSFSTVSRDFCVCNGDLFMAGYYNDSGTEQEARLWKFIDTGWLAVHTFNSSPHIDNDFQDASGNPILFTPDNQNLVFISPGENGSNVPGDQAALIQNPGTASQIITDITNPVIPPQFRPGGTSAVGTARYMLFTDTQNSASPTSPDFYIWRLGLHNTGNWGFYQYTNTSTELTYLGIGPSFSNMGPHIKQGGQGRISAGANATTTNKIYVELESPVISSFIGSMDVGFRVYGSGTGIQARVYVSSQQETPDTQITITAVTGGSASVAGNVISNITADDGATLYTFTWAASTDGITNGVPATLVMNVTD